MREKRDQLEQKNNWTINRKYSKDKSTKTRVTLPYIRGVSEAWSWVFYRHVVATLIKLHLTLKSLRMLVHFKDKCTPQENSGIGLSMHLHR